MPTLRDLLEPAAARPQVFMRGSDIYDPVRVGFLAEPPPPAPGEPPLFRYDTRIPGNGNRGHEGPAYGTELPAADKDALVEYLKTF